MGTSRNEPSALRILNSPIIWRSVFGARPTTSLINAAASIFSSGAVAGRLFVPWARAEQTKQRRRTKFFTWDATQWAALQKYVWRNAPSFCRECPPEPHPSPCDFRLATGLVLNRCGPRPELFL